MCGMKVFFHLVVNEEEQCQMDMGVRWCNPFLWLNLGHMYIHYLSTLALQLPLVRLYYPRVHLEWAQTAPLGAFMPTTMWLS